MWCPFSASNSHRHQHISNRPKLLIHIRAALPRRLTSTAMLLWHTKTHTLCVICTYP
jgi:hypothetical protein